MASRVLTFSCDDKMKYRFVFMAALNGSAIDGAGQQKQRSWEEQRADGKVMRALKAISEEKVENAGQPNEMRSRVLKSEGGTVTLTGEQFDKLKTWWGRIQWPVFDIDQIEDAYEWLCSASEV